MGEAGRGRRTTRASRQGDDGYDEPVRRRGWARRHPFWTTILVLAVVCLVIPIAVVAVAYNRIEVPKPGSIVTNQVSEIHLSDGTTLMGRIVPDQGNRTEVDIDVVPVHVRNAVIAAEDRSFYSNEGFDPTGIGRAAVGQVTGESSKGGGSTITQQYIKNTMVGDERSYTRKAKEILIAAKMTNEWSKDQILEAYLNTIYFGRSAYGIAAAARAYFNKPVEMLTVEEGAVLASSIQSPSALDPASNRPAAEARWNYVLDGMRDMGALPAQQRTAAVYPQVVEDPQAIEQNVGDPTNGPIRRQVLAELAASGVSEQMLNTRGLKITTTIDPKIQSSVVSAARENMKGEAPDNRTAAVSIDPRSGAVRGYYGGEAAEGWDYANAALQTGSTFKIFGLAAALDQGIPLSRQFSSAPITSGNVTINNSDGMTCGTCSIATALKMSLNTSFIRLQQVLDKGPVDTQQMAYKAGVPERIPGLPVPTLTENGGDPYDGIILGQYPIRVLDMATGISTFADQGTYHRTHFIEKVVAADGEVLVDNSGLAGEQRIDKDVANNLVSAMQPIAAYSRGHALAGGRVSASKSGTTQLGDTGLTKDAWFVGFTPSLATAVWVGTDDNKPLYGPYGALMFGSMTPADIWKSAMDGALAGTDYETFPTPGAIGGQAGAPGDAGTYSSGQGTGGTSSRGYSTQDYQAPRSTSAPQPTQQQQEQSQPQQPAPLTLSVPGLPEIVIPGAGGTGGGVGGGIGGGTGGAAGGGAGGTGGGAGAGGGTGGTGGAAGGTPRGN